MKLSTQLSYAGGFKEAVDQVVELEKAGLDMVWVAEAYSFDAVSSMGYLAATHRPRCRSPSGILPIYTRTPTLLAMTAAGIDALSDGRCILGLGASGPQVIEGFHGVPYDKPLGRTREIIDICRQVWRRERVEHDGASYQIPAPRGAGHRARQAAEAHQPPRAQRDPDLRRVARPEERRDDRRDGRRLAAALLPAREGQGRVGRRPRRRRRQARRRPRPARGRRRRPAVGRRRRRGRPRVRPPDDRALRRRHGRQGPELLQRPRLRYGYEEEAEEIQDLYLDGKKDEAAKLVPDELLEATTLCGPEGYVKERIAAFKESGVTVLNVTPVGPDPVKLIEQVKGWIEDL